MQLECFLHALCFVIFPLKVRRCRLDGLLDLNHDLAHVQNMISLYLNELIDMGIAGVRLDAAKHIWPKDVAAIIGMTKSLRPDVQRFI